MDTIKRSIELPKDHSFFLFGPRQTGKSTLLKMLFLKENILFYNLLDKETFLRFLSHPSLLREEVHSRRKEITHVIIDEVQRIPDLLNEVHLIMESPNPPFFVLTGSSARRLKRHEANLLAGRALSYSLHPFAIERLRAYVDTYLQEEIEREAQLRRIDRFSHFLLIAGSENGNVINYSNIARETSVSLSTVKGYFQILVDTLIGRFIYPFTKSVRHRLSKHLKSLRSFAEASPGAKLCCVCQAPHRMERNAITILPWQELLTWLTEALAPDHLPR